MEPASSLPLLLGLAWLLPLGSFTLIVFGGRRLGSSGRLAGTIAAGAIGTAALLSFIALFAVWLPQHPIAGGDHHAHAGPAYYAGNWYTLCQFGSLELTIGYYIDALTVTMFCMVTLIASCIHVYSMGYMHEELHDVTDHEVTLSNGQPLTRRGRYHRFFQYLSLFSFSMLGLVIAGNVAMVFVFWELVGICSYFLIGFYIERKSASNAANKAFIVNRVGDFGMLIGLMILFGTLGTFAFGDRQDDAGHVVLGEHGEPAQPGLFSLIRPGMLDGHDNHHALVTPDGMVQAAMGDELAEIRLDHAGHAEADVATEMEIASRTRIRRGEGTGYWLLVIAGLGIFCGCVGKSAQFPLHTWLPDAMEGPTPVSALVHSATMVAAGVYLVGRMYPLFTPEVLLVIAYVGCVTLFLAATIAITATDIKRVLAYSTVSQLGYMMLALGVGGWLAGMFHLITHAFFKGLLFLCSGSVIHAVHTNEMPQMGGLRKKMPWTAGTMLIGCLAIIGAGIPFVIGMSGYYSKDAILEQALSYSQVNPIHNLLFLAAAGGAAITAFYMFRLWYMTFAGKPRDEHRFEHAHESPLVMVVPLVILAVFAIGIGWRLPGSQLSVGGLLEQARPAGTLATVEGGMLLDTLTVPDEHLSHEPAIRVPATLIAFATAMGGLLLATVIYCWRLVDPKEIRQQFQPIYRFLLNKWWFDELYNAIFVQPVLFVSRRCAQLDRRLIDRMIDGGARITAWLARAGERVVDQGVVDGSVNAFAYKTWNLALSLRAVQTGRLRVYVVSIVVCTVALWVLISYVRYALAG